MLALFAAAATTPAGALLHIRAAAGAAGCSSSSVRRLGTAISALLGAPPVQEGSSTSSGISTPQQDQQQQQHSQQPGCELPPALCGEPKNKLSLHRRGNRRQPYYAKRKELFAYCKFCGQTGTPHQFLAANPACSGQCLQQQPDKRYPQEYRPPL